MVFLSKKVNLYSIKNYFSILIIILTIWSCNKQNPSQEDSNLKVLKKYNEYRSGFFESPDKRDSLNLIILGLENDTLKNNLIFEISYYYYQEKDSSKFRFWNNKTKELSFKLKDSAKIAESYWDLASFFYHKNLFDSSYFNYNKAYFFYESSGDKYQSSRMLLNLANIQKNIKDYVGSEITTVAAIKSLKPLKKYSQLYSAYNNLGIVNNELKEYDKALEFHQKAIDYEREFGSNVLKASSFNNIGVVYSNKKEYEKSLEYFAKALSIDSVYIKNPSLYAMLLDNSAYSRFKLNDSIDLEDEFLNALKIRDSIDHKAGIITNHLHLGEYYLSRKDTLRALKQIKNAKSLSEEYNSYGDLLKSLIFLSKIDPQNSEQYYTSYISLSDSLQNEERAIRNKFARIRFETDEFIAENENLAQKNFWIITGSTSVLILFLLLYVIKIEKDRNRKLLLVQKQQLANEEIYNLLLDSQNKLEEGKEKEKKRISKELHDGILSKFFGVRLNLELLNDSLSIESISEREKYIHELKLLENEIRNVSHQLNDNMFSNENSFKTITQELLISQKDFGKFKYILDFNTTIVWDEVSSKIKINVYRILQEAIHNINKYSEASLVEIMFTKLNNKLKVRVKDDGVGFDTNLTSDGIGHLNMKSRIRDLNGEIQFKSSNSGTEIIMYIPLNY